MLCLPREMISSGRMRFHIGPKIDNMQLKTLSVTRSGKPASSNTMLQPAQNTSAACHCHTGTPQPAAGSPALKQDLQQAEHLGKTADGKSILLLSADRTSPALQEIGRLREAAFRAVGEGTGACRDLDHYDRYYRHIVLWDDHLLEIAGAYRLGEIWAGLTRIKKALFQ